MGSGSCGVGSGICGMRSGRCGVGSGICGLGSGSCVVGSGICGMGIGSSGVSCSSRERNSERPLMTGQPQFSTLTTTIKCWVFLEKG